MARYPPSLESPVLFFLEPRSSCSSRRSSSRRSSHSTTAAAGVIYSSSNNSTRLPSAISLAAASRVQTGMYHPPKMALFSRSICRVIREYMEQNNDHI